MQKTIDEVLQAIGEYAQAQGLTGEQLEALFEAGKAEMAAASQSGAPSIQAQSAGVAGVGTVTRRS